MKNVRTILSDPKFWDRYFAAFDSSNERNSYSRVFFAIERALYDFDIKLGSSAKFFAANTNPDSSFHTTVYALTHHAVSTYTYTVTSTHTNTRGQQSIEDQVSPELFSRAFGDIVQRIEVL